MGGLKDVPRPAAEVARHLRNQQLRRVDSLGRHYLCERPWSDIRDELARLGFGVWAAEEISAAVAALPIHTHDKAPLPDAELMALDASWRDGWAREFPAEPYPGMVDARRRIRAKLFTRS